MIIKWLCNKFNKAKLNTIPIKIYSEAKPGPEFRIKQRFKSYIPNQKQQLREKFCQEFKDKTQIECDGPLYSGLLSTSLDLGIKLSGTSEVDVKKINFKGTSYIVEVNKIHKCLCGFRGIPQDNEQPERKSTIQQQRKKVHNHFLDRMKQRFGFEMTMDELNSIAEDFATFHGRKKWGAGSPWRKQEDQCFYYKFKYKDVFIYGLYDFRINSFLTCINP